MVHHDSTKNMPAPMRTENSLGLGLLRQPGTVIFGPGQRREIAPTLANLGSHALITTDARMANSTEFAELKEQIEAAGLEVSVYSSTEPDLPRRNVVEVVAQFGSSGVDVLLGLGGGSCMDLAKVASIVMTNGGDVRDYFGEFLVSAPGLPVVTVPTTGGTGAEITCISVVFDEEQQMKVGVASPYLEARATIIDPEFTLTCPAGLTAATGADALSHLIEGFTARAKNPNSVEISGQLYVGKNVLTDSWARAGLEKLGTSLERIAANPSDLAGRTDTMFAAFAAGMVINTTGTAGMHAIQSPIGNRTHTPHGFGISALMPYVMRYNLPARVHEFAQLGEYLGVDSKGDELDRAKAGIERVDEILEALGAPTDLKELGLEPDDFELVARQAMLSTRLTANNPRELTETAICEILRRGYDADRSWWVE